MGEDPPPLAVRLKARREELGLSRSEAARELDVARTAYRLWELEAARPAPDRWRLVARWLGVSMSTLLLAEGVISEDEAAASTTAADRYAASTGTGYDAQAEAESGDFFEQAQAMIDRSIEQHLLTAAEAQQLRAVFRRIERGLAADAPAASLRAVRDDEAPSDGSDEIQMGNGKTVTIGRVRVPRIGLGTNRLTHTPAHVAFVRDAVAAGIRHIDTAYTYAGGESERTIGEALSPKPEDVVVATKGGYAPGTGRPAILRRQLDESLGRLGADAIDLYYLHRVDPETPFEDSVGALREAVDAGKIRHVGLSKVGVEQIELARTIVPIAAVQNHYNLTERGSDEVIDHCAREGIVFAPYFPLKDDATEAVDRVAARHAATPARVRLAWLLRRSANTLPIPGTLSVEHVKDNLAALELELTDEELQRLR